jgi:hypothetical protein
MDMKHGLRVFENRVLRRIFGPKRDEVARERKNLHNEELCDLYPLPSTIRIIKSWRMRWEGHVARIGEKENAYRLLVGKPEGRKTKIILGWILDRWDGVMWTGFVWLRIWTNGELL